MMGCALQSCQNISELSGSFYSLCQLQRCHRLYRLSSKHQARMLQCFYSPCRVFSASAVLCCQGLIVVVPKHLQSAVQSLYPVLVRVCADDGAMRLPLSAHMLPPLLVASSVQ